MNEISRKLTKLKLSGIATILEQRLKQASEENWPYEVFLETLLTDEIERKQNKKLNVRLAKSMLDLTKTMETFDFKFNVKVPIPTFLVSEKKSPFLEKKWTLVMYYPPTKISPIPNSSASFF